MHSEQSGASGGRWCDFGPRNAGAGDARRSPLPPRGL